MPYDFNSHINPDQQFMIPENEPAASRLSWPDYFMNLANQISRQSTCLRRKVGALAVRDKRILATGYNGAPAGLKHCAETGCLRDQLNIPSGERHELCRAVHAEQNVICQAASSGVSSRAPSSTAPPTPASSALRCSSTAASPASSTATATPTTCPPSFSPMLASRPCRSAT